MKKNIIEKELDLFNEEIKFNEVKLNQNKNKLIGEIKNGLGKKIKENPNQITFIQPRKLTIKEKLINFLSKI